MNRLSQKQRALLTLILVNVVLIAIAFAWSHRRQPQTVAVAVAKSKQMLDQNLAFAPNLDAAASKSIALDDAALSSAENQHDLEFVNAILLNDGEARYWQDAGCGAGNCAQVTFFNHALGGSTEAIVNLDSETLVASWQNEYARPAGTTWILPRALAIAAEDAQVTSILGDIGDADPAMVPMSGWLADSACRTEWCVDLTFHDPNGTGKIFHVFVNMESDQVERTFYTRSREERSAAAPLAQRNAFSDGCHEQYGWEVCWEMTANDGIDFQDAAFDGKSVFRSAKIGQVEAWYPSWPGGYRDEIGFSASVPPYGDTIVNDLGNGFEVRQFFTEFERWPNCICCYRYEQVIQFMDDGALEFQFVSHGPGCDDLSVYRPFWRIDVDLDDPENDDVYLWNELEWQEQDIEFEEHPMVEHTSPEGHKLAIVDGSQHYRWKMVETDPLGRDEGYLFLLQFNENEGTGPIAAGPGDTFIPPRQWINGDDLSGENIVLWHVPLMKTIKGNPYWCMPDPEPDFSPCHAVLRAEPGWEFVQLSPAELAILEAEENATPTPAAVVTPEPSPTPRPIDGSEPEEIALNAGCTSCHQIGDLGEGHKVGPDLSDIGWSAQGRVEGMAAEAYVRQSIVDPNVYLAPECPNGPCMENIMPRDYGHRLTEQQQEVLVSFLLSQRLTVPTQEDGSTENSVPAGETDAPANQSEEGRQQQEILALRLVSVLILSLGFFISLLIYFRSSPSDNSGDEGG